MPSGHSGPVLTLSNAARSSPFRPHLVVADAGVWGTFLLGVAFRHVICGVYLLFPSQSGCPPRFKNFPQTRQCKTPFPGRISVLSSFVSLFIFYILPYLLSKTMGCFSGCLMTSASDQKLFCEVCSAFGYSFDEFLGERVVSPSCSSTSLAPPPLLFHFHQRLFSSSLLSAMKMVSSAYLRLLIFLLVILIQACASSNLAFHMMFPTILHFPWSSQPRD